MNSGIEVFFTQVNKPWSNVHPGYPYGFHVNVFSPDGQEVIGVPAPNGYAMIDLPPGRYLVVGTLYGIYVNFDSNETIVNVGFGQKVGVTIIPRSLHSCIWWLTAALQLIDEHPDLAPDVAKTAPDVVKMLTALEKAIPKENRSPAFLAASLNPIREALKKAPPK